MEVNYWLTKGFIGTGMGGWDLTHADTRATAWLFHFGRGLHRTADESKLLFIVQGRLFLNELNDTSNNYQFWGGVRMVFR